MQKRIGGYRVERRLGQGGMGEVFLAWDERLERWVAIKRIRHAGDVLPAPLRERFQREARLAARLSHPAIVQVYELITDESGDALVMEYVEGVTLKLRLAASPLKAAEALRLAREIAEGLEAAHDAGLIHRDLKAENVVVTPAGHAKILDFGLARSLEWSEESITLDGTVIGTLHTMSPEQARGEDLDARTDLFSFGVLLYEMLAGRSPFRGKNALETLRRLDQDDPPPLSSLRPDLPRSLSVLVEELLAKERGHRPDNASHVVFRLERIARELSPPEDTVDESVVSGTPTRPYPLNPWKRKERKRFPRIALRWVFAGAVATAVALSVLLFAQSPEALYRLYRLADSRGDLDKAEAFLDQAISKDPDNWKYQYWRADLLLKRGQVDDARNILNSLLQKPSSRKYARQELAYLGLLYGDLPLAAESYRKIIADGTPERSDYTNLGMALTLLGNYKEAAKAYGHANELDPGDKTVMLNLADLRRFSGDQINAEAMYGGVKKQFDKNARDIDREKMILAQCLVNLHDAKGAKDTVQEVMQNDPHDPQIYYQAALVYARAGDLDTALMYAKKALDARLPPRWFEGPDFKPLREKYPGLIDAAGPASRR